MALITKKTTEQKVSSISSILIIVIFIFSAYTTFNIALQSFDSKITALIIAFIVETVKFVFAHFFFSKKVDGFNIYEWLYLIIWVVFVSVSIMFSSASINHDLKVKVETLTSESKENKEIVSQMSDIDKQIELLSKNLISSSEIEKNTTSTTQNNTNVTKQIESITNTIVQKQNKLTNTNSKFIRVRNDLQKEIKILESQKQNLLKNILAVDNTQINSNQSISDKIEVLRQQKVGLGNKKVVLKELTSFEEILVLLNCTPIIFWILFSAILELVGFILIKHSNEKKDNIKREDEEDMDINEPIRMRNEPKLIEPKIIKPDLQLQSFATEMRNNPNVDIVLQYINEHNKEGKIEGYKKIGEILSIKQYEMLKILGYLEELGFIHKNDKRYFIK